MSGFAVVFERSNTPVDTGVLDRVMERLNHRGPDGRDSLSTGPIAMGHWHFWLTPEEAGERQPVEIPGLPYIMVMDGRLDNRADIFNHLEMGAGEAAQMSDAVLILRAFARWGEECFEKLVGEFALVLYDVVKRELILARDPLGDRSLFYAQAGTWVVIASEPRAVASELSQSVEFNDVYLAHHFALISPPDGQTLFKGVTELQPAQYLKISMTGEQRQTYWQPVCESTSARYSETEYIDQFCSLLEDSVRCRLRSITPPAVLMSGGLDSTSVACLAARLSAPSPLVTLSYIFDDFQECDERPYINAVRDQYGAHSIQILCDDLWPFQEGLNFPVDPNWPVGNIYYPLLHRTFNRAKDEGIRVILTGSFGDDLYTDSEEFLADAWRSAQWGWLSHEIAYLLKHYSLRKLAKARVTRALVKGMVPRPLLHKRKKPSSPIPEWLTGEAARLLQFETHPQVPGRQLSLFCALNAAASSRQGALSCVYGQEMRHPYRDRRLIEFFLSLPAYMLYSQGFSKYILRQAMNGILPDLVRERQGYTALFSLYNYGLKYEKSFLSHHLRRENAAWRRYVKPEFVLNQLQQEVKPANDGGKAAIMSLCFLFEQWYKSNTDLSSYVEDRMENSARLQDVGDSSQEISQPKIYKSPRLEVLGDLRALTLGGSPGIGESGPGQVPPPYFTKKISPGVLPGDSDDRTP